MNPNNELLPCPFCGSKNLSFVCEPFKTSRQAYVYCRDCFSQGRVLMTDDLHGDDVREYCFKQWNTRHTPQPSADSGMKNAEDIIKKWSKLYNDRYNELDSEATEKIGDGIVPSEDIHEIIIREILQDAFAAGVRSTKEKGE